MAKTPVVVSLQCCEQVIIEEGTRNQTLVNCFNRREVENVPAELFHFVLFAVLADGMGEMPVEVTIQRLDTGEDILQQGTSIRFTSPLQEAQFRIRVRNCVFPVAGSYQISLLVNREALAQRKSHIVMKGDGQ